MNPKSVFPYAKRHQSMTLARRWLSALALFLLLLSSLSPARPASAEGTKELVANDPGTAYRAVTEWRTGTLAGLYRRTFLRVYARAGETINLGSSAIGYGSADIALYRESQIPHSQIDASFFDPASPNRITPAFSCNTYRATNPGAGALDTRAKELAGPLPNAGGYTPCVYTAPASETYWVAMFGPLGPNSNTDAWVGTVDNPLPANPVDQNSGVTMWDITVRDGSTTQPSRVFVDYLAQITGNSNRPLMSTVYAVTEDGFIYQVDFNELDPYGFIFYGNRVGFLDPDGVTPLYHDLVANNAELTDIQGGVLLAPATAKMFFNDPRLADDLPPSVLPTPTPPDITNISFSGSAGGLDGYFGIGGEFTYTGNIGGISEIIIQGPTSTDFAPDNPRNRVLRSQSVVGTNVITWDGLDNEGIPFPVRTDYPFQVIFHAGEYHFPLLDVENSPSGGPIFTLLNPLGGICPLSTCRQAFYDDRGYVVSNGTTVGTPGVVLPGGLNPPTTPSSDMIAGFDTATNQRAWGDNPTNYQNGFGNIKGLDLWTYYPVYPVEGTLNVVPQVAQDVNIVKKHTGLFSIGNNGDAFQITARNVGYSTINGAISVNDALPPGLTPISASGSGWSCSISGQDVYCTHPNAAGLPSMVSLPPITVVVYVNPYAAPSASNTAYVLNDNDSNLNNNSYTDTVTIDSVDIAVQKSADNLAPEVGDTVTFTISATNNGPSTADSIVLSDALPAGLTYVSHTTSQGDYSTSTGAWTVGALPAGYTATLTLTASVDAGTYGQSLTNTAAVASTIPYDYNSANNSASVTLEVVQTTLQGIITDSATGLPIAGATVTVTDSTSTTYTVVTGADGSYRVEGLADGAATVSAAAEGYQPSGSIPVTLTYGVVNTQDIALDPAADLELTKTDARSAVLPDTDITYTITVTNRGAAAALGVQVIDPLGPSLGVHDPNLTIVSLTLGGAPVSYSTDGSGNTLWSAPDLDPGESAAYLLTVHLSASATGSVTNYAEASTTTTELDTADNAQSDTDAIQSIADLSITLDDGVTTVQAGESLTYTLTYANLGTATASAPVVTVQVPAGLTGITPNNGGTYNAGTGVITWNLSNLPAGASGSLSFTAAVAASAAPGAVITPSAAISSASPDLDSANNSASDSDTVVRPVLTLAKSASGTVEVGVPLTYTIDYTNTSTVAAQNVVITDALPTGMDYFAGCYPPGCAVVGSTLTWTVGTVAPGASGSVSFQVAPTIAAGSGTITNTANAAYRGSVAGINYTATASADVTLALQLADLSITKSGTPANPAPGGTLTYTITVSNAGPAALSAINVTDLFPTGVTGVTFTPSAGVYDPTTGDWTGLSLASGGSVTLTILADVSDTASGALTNSAYVFSSEAEDPDLSNNQASSTSTVTTAATYSIGDWVWEDLNMNGIQDAGEPGVSGAQVRLYSSGNNILVGSAITPASGAYSFANVSPGTYYLVFTTPAGYTRAPQDRGGNDAVDSDASAATGQTANITITNANTTAWDAGMYRQATLGSRAWYDTDGDGIQDAGETSGPSGLEVRLYSCGADAVCGSADDSLAATTTTGASGAYSFNPNPGTYYIHVDAPAGYTFGPQTTGTTDGSDVNPFTGNTPAITLTSGQVNNDIDVSLAQGAILGDRLWIDADGDGIQDATETAGYGDVTVTLYDSGGTAIRTATTASDGSFSFAGVAPGTYSVGFPAITGYTYSPQDQGSDDSLDSDANPSTRRTTNFTVSAGEIRSNLDAGVYTNGSVTSFVWNDGDGDGIQDGGEGGLNGVSVLLRSCGSDGVCGNGDDTTVQTVTTPASGNATFNNVSPGLYYLRYTPLTNYSISSQDSGANDAVDSDPDPVSGDTAGFFVTSGSAITNMDAGMDNGVSVVGDFVWFDTDRDGIQDAGEPGIADVTVTMRRSNNNASEGTVTTDSSGRYAFTNVANRGHYLEFTLPTGHTFSPRNVNDNGGDDTGDDPNDEAIDSDPSTTNGRTAAFTTASSTYSTWDAGMYTTNTLRGRAWTDANADGVRSGETNLAGVTVGLYNAAGTLVATTTTAADGTYSFTNRPPGTYTVGFTAPANHYFSPQDRGGNDAVDSDANPATGRTASVTIGAGGQITDNVDVGLYQRATIGDRAWYDTNGNGIQDAGETGGPSGLAVQLYSCGADGTCGNADDSLSATTTTGANGAYSFSANPGTYYVHVDAPSGYTFGPNTTGTAATGSDVNPLTGNTPAITVTSNQVNNDIDVSLAPGATLGDRLWIDSDADGIQDATETAGYGGATVRLYNSGGAQIGLTTTASDGSYAFAGVAAGTYSLGFDPITSYTYTRQDQGSDDSLDSDANTTTGRTANFTVSAGEVRTNLDAGVYTSGSVTTFVWSDNDRDGVQDGGEGGLNGVSVLLRSCGSDGVCGNGDDSTAQTASTAGGNTTFNNVTPGLYYLRYTAPPNYTFTYQDSGANDAVDSDPDPISGDTAGFLVSSGSAITNMDAGLLNGRSVVGDFVWFDTDRDGIQDAGEPGIPNVTVTLRRFDTHASAGTDTTDASGRYIIPNIENYTYYLEFTVPSGYTVSPSIQGGNDLLDSDVYYDSANARWRTRQFTTNISTFSNYDMGMYTSSTVTGRAWTDADANGVRQTGEPALVGITVGLYNAAGTLVATTTTAADGTYSFTYVLPGTYSVRFIAPDASYSFTTPLYGGDSTRDSNAVAVTPTTDPPTGQTAAFTLSPDQTLANIDAGLYQRVTIGDYVWDDTDGDGVQDAGEPGISGRTVELRRSVTNALVASATTNASGQYSFNVAPGSYYVRFSLLSGYVYSPRGVGADATNSDADTTTGQTAPFTMTSGQSNLNLDAGMLNNVASIGDFTWRDTNGNGIQDAGETGLVGVSVALYTSAGTLVSTTTSSSTGYYSFSNVAPGDYYLIFTAPGGYSFGPDGRGSDPTRDSNADPLTGQTGTFTVTAGLTQSAVDAALVPNRAVIGDRVWDDADGDGIQDAGEAGISGVTVRLYRELVSGSSPLDGMLLAGTLIANTTTDSAGEYVFTNLTPGTYTVGFVRPSGYVYSMPDQGSDASIDSNADPFTGESAPVSVVGGETNRTLDAALIYGRATVGSRVWNDIDTDGIQDTGEQGLRGITVRLYNDSGVLVATTTTGLTGQYAFTNLAPGSYRVQFVNSSGLLIGPLNQGGDGTTDSDADPNNSGYTSVFTIAGGDINGTLDASMYADPTGVDVGNLEAVAGRNGVTLTWQSTSETEIEGYNVYRAEVGSSDETLLTAQMIDALYSGDSLGMIYNWVDYSPLPFKQYVYTVEVIHLDGSTTRLSVIVETLPYMIYLPMLGR